MKKMLKRKSYCEYILKPPNLQMDFEILLHVCVTCDDNAKHQTCDDHAKHQTCDDLNKHHTYDHNKHHMHMWWLQ